MLSYIFFSHMDITNFWPGECEFESIKNVWILYGNINSGGEICSLKPEFAMGAPL